LQVREIRLLHRQPEAESLKKERRDTEEKAPLLRMSAIEGGYSTYLGSRGTASGAAKQSPDLSHRFLLSSPVCGVQHNARSPALTKAGYHAGIVGE
jgi:hypothetical protein